MRSSAAQLLSESQPAVALNPAQRARDLERLRTETFDVVVIGGGVTGAGIALDAATRGLSVALVEANDFASGTSSKSSKLIHGGLRYLEMLDFKLVREALKERRLLLQTLAPHLVRPVPFIWPLTHRVWERLYLGAGLALYDTIGGAGAVPRHRHLSKAAMRHLAPGLDPQSYVGGVQFYDAQEDDARMVAVIARTAASYGAAIVTDALVTRFRLDGDRVCGVEARDGLSGEHIEVRAAHVAGAVGVWRDELLAILPGRQDVSSSSIRPSKGVHIVVDRNKIEADVGVLMRTEKSVLFVIPWGTHWVIGDTDTDWVYSKDHPAASGADVDYLLSKVNSVLKSHLTRDDIVGVFAGLRPLVQNTATADTTKLSREHFITSPTPGLSMIAGGKFTTYRVMAKDMVDIIAADLDRSAGPSVTHTVPLLGAQGYHERTARPAEVAQQVGVSEAAAIRLLGRYGSCIDDLTASIAADPDLACEVPGAEPYLWAEIVYACTHEGALHLADVLERRTRIRFELGDAGLTAAPAVVERIAPLLGWSDAESRLELERYQNSVVAERRALLTADDQGAVTQHIRASAQSEVPP